MAQKQVDTTRRTFSDPNIATFEGSAYKNAASRLGAGQARYPDTPVFDQDTGEFWALRPLHLCFAADGVTPAINRGNWGSLKAHWRPFFGTPGTPAAGGSFAFQSADVETLTVVIAKDSNSPDDLDEYYIYVGDEEEYFFEGELFERPFWE